MGERESKQCESERVPELSESESRVLWKAYEEDLFRPAVLYTWRAGGPVRREREAW